MTESARDRDYEVGYGKPPKATQWKPGQSGNPKGRPKKIKDFDALFDRELSETVRVTEGGMTKFLTKRELLVKRLVSDAIKGDRTTMKLCFNHMKNNPSVEEFEIDADDQKALLDYAEKLKLETQAPSEEPGKEADDA